MMLKTVKKRTLNILRCEYGKILKLILLFFNIMREKVKTLQEKSKEIKVNKTKSHLFSFI